MFGSFGQNIDKNIIVVKKMVKNNEMILVNMQCLSISKNEVDLNYKMGYDNDPEVK